MIALTDAEKAQLADLATREKARRGTKDELDRDSENLYTSLCHLRQIEMQCMIPTPTCCEAARTHPAILTDVADYDSEPGKDPGRWYLTIDSKQTRARHTVRSGTWIDDLSTETAPPSPKFCPYCGTALPALRRKVPEPEKLCDPRGGDYCGTCDERLMNCLCDPPSSAFEPVNSDQSSPLTLDGKLP